MKLYLGVTDNSWFNYLQKNAPEDVNFWQPGGKTPFKILDPGGPFLFKLKSPLNVIAGIGFFSTHSFLPLSVAWEIFQTWNGCESLFQFKNLILNYRTDKRNSNPTIGCIVLTNPLFFKEEDWILVPRDWSRSIVQGKSYDTDSLIGSALWGQILSILPNIYNQIMKVKKAN